MKKHIKELALPLCAFLVCFSLSPLIQLNYLELIPGDVGDALLCNYFLENIFLFICGKSESLWNLPFFHPFPYVLGFSENLFGSSIFYIIPRFLKVEPQTAFQIWFLIGYLLNYISSYWALRYIKMSVVSATVGAMIFTFALPTTAHAGHEQLHYRFGIPLSITLLISFLVNKNWVFLPLSGLF